MSKLSRIWRQRVLIFLVVLTLIVSLTQVSKGWQESHDRVSLSSGDQQVVDLEEIDLDEIADKLLNGEQIDSKIRIEPGIRTRIVSPTQNRDLYLALERNNYEEIDRLLWQDPASTTPGEYQQSGIQSDVCEQVTHINLFEASHGEFLLRSVVTCVSGDYIPVGVHYTFQRSSVNDQVSFSTIESTKAGFKMEKIYANGRVLWSSKEPYKLKKNPGTSMIRVVFVPLVISQDPENPIYYTRLDPGYIDSWPFNNDLNPYPWIFPLGFRGNVGDDPETNAYVPFPAPPFANCEPALRDQFDPNCPYRPMPLDLFQCRVRHYYDDQNWLDQQGYQTHHIKPVACGGSSNGSNGVLLLEDDHKQFTKWWRSFDQSICRGG